MKPARWKLISALVLFALLLSGCINIQQEYWLNGDGSAKVSMDVGMSEALLSMGSASGGSSQTSPLDDLKKTFSTTNPHIKNVQVHEYKDNSLDHFAVTFDVNNFEDFLKTQSSQSGELNITLTHQDDGSIVFNQFTALNTGNQTQGLDPSSMGSVFKDMYWTVTVHVPQVVSTNGTKVDNGTVSWKIPMADVFAGKAPSKLTVNYKPTGSGSSAAAGWVWLIVVLVVLILAGGAAYYFLVLRKRTPAAQAPLSSGPDGGYPPPGGPYSPGPAPQPGYPPVQPQAGYPQQAAPSYPAPVPPQGGLPPQGGQWASQGGAVQPGSQAVPTQPPAGFPQQVSPPSYPLPVPPQRGKLPPTKPLSPPPAEQYPQYQFPQFPPAPPVGGIASYPSTPVPPPQPPAAPPPEAPPES